MDNSLSRHAAFVETIPTVFGYLGIAAAFGIIGRASGFSILTVCLMSIIIYAGSAQFTTVSMLAAGSPILSIILATFLINSRMILMSTTLAPYFKKDSVGKGIAIGTLLTDESFALGVNKLNYTGDRLTFTWQNTTNTISYLTWIIATALGAFLGSLFTDPKKLGLDFAVVAMFIGLLYLQIVNDKKMKKVLQVTIILITLALTYLSMIFLPKNIVILVATVLGCISGMVVKHVFF